MIKKVTIKFESGNEFNLDVPRDFSKDDFLELVEKGKKINAPFEFPGVETKMANEYFKNIVSIEFN